MSEMKPNGISLISLCSYDLTFSVKMLENEEPIKYPITVLHIATAISL